MTSAQPEDATHPCLGRLSRRWVYLIGSPMVRPVKIGVSDDPEERLDDLQVGSPVPLELLWQVNGGQRLESDLHERFAAHRTHGEWFDFGSADPVMVLAEEAARLGYGPLPVIPFPRMPVTPPPQPVGRVEPDTARGRLLAALADGPAAPRELAHSLGFSRMAVYRPLERLVRQGHVVWLPDGRVSRVQELEVAPKGPGAGDRVLSALAEGPMRQKDVAEVARLPKGTISKAVARLSEAGRVVRLDDGRVALA